MHNLLSGTLIAIRDGVSIGLIILVAGLYLAGVAGSVLLIIAAFRVSVGWGFGVMLIPFGSFVFRFSHPDDVGNSFRISRICYTLCIVLIAANPETFGTPSGRLTAITSAWQHRSGAPVDHNKRSVALAEKDADSESSDKEDPTDLAQAGSLPAQQEIYRQHVAELSVVYERLKTERVNLKVPGPAMTAFNAKAADYQLSLRKLAEEKTQLDALERTAATKTPNNRTYTEAVAYSLPGPGAGTKAAH